MKTTKNTNTSFKKAKDTTSRLAELRESKIIFYVTGDKNPVEKFGTVMALDTLPIFYEQLSKLGKQKKISLFLYSNGGHLNAPWPIVNLIREYCDEFEVIIPFKALSAATLISLGADKILMTPFSQLGPIDPIGNFQIGENKRENISIEDVTGYVSFAKEKVGIAEQSALAEVLKKLSEQIKPSIIGSINRTHSLIRELAKKMLRLHKKELEDETAQKIVDNLVERLFSHDHFINRSEAEKIGLKGIIQYASEEEEGLINEIFDQYKTKLELNKNFNPLEILGNDVEKEYSLIRAVVESSEKKNKFVSKYKITKAPSPQGQTVINVASIGDNWE